MIRVVLPFFEPNKAFALTTRPPTLPSSTNLSPSGSKGILVPTKGFGFADKVIGFIFF
jgi:hypothetical protein